MHLNCDIHRLTMMILKALICFYCDFFIYSIWITVVIFMFNWLVITIYSVVYMLFVNIVVE